MKVRLTSAGVDRVGTLVLGLQPKKNGKGNSNRRGYSASSLARHDMNMKKSSFQVNRLYGLSGMFPLGFDLQQAGKGLWRAFLHAQSVSEASEILPMHAKEKICIFSVHHNIYDPESGEAVSLEQIAKQLGLSAVVPDKDVILINTTELPLLLADFNHYDMSLLDIGHDMHQDRALDCVHKAIAAESGQGQSVLDNIPSSDVYIKSHDDCYLFVESRHITHLKDHLRCLLKNYVFSKLEKSISLPPPAITDEYLFKNSSITILDERIDLVIGILRMPCSSEAFSFQQPGHYPVTATILYDTKTSHWRLDRQK